MNTGSLTVEKDGEGYRFTTKPGVVVVPTELAVVNTLKEAYLPFSTVKDCRLPAATDGVSDEISNTALYVCPIRAAIKSEITPAIAQELQEAAFGGREEWRGNRARATSKSPSLR